MNLLEQYGWTDQRDQDFAEYSAKGMIAGRVMLVHSKFINVVTADGEMRAETSGKFRHEARSQADMPAVGDWVVLKIIAQENRATIHAILPRTTAFIRKAAGQEAVEQVVAANVDYVFIVTSMNDEFNPRRLERYLALTKESGATAAIVLTKADLCPNPQEYVDIVHTVAPQTEVYAISNITGEGIDTMAACIAGNTTVAMLGSSGVGKSTLINRLIGEERQVVREIRDDSKGRHTTTHRELIRLASGGLVIDTPGMREIQMIDRPDGFHKEFEDIAELSLQCRFTNCAHNKEPGCAVLKAVEDGKMDAARLVSYHKLLQEMRRFEILHDKRLKAEENKRVKVVHRVMRRFKK